MSLLLKIIFIILSFQLELLWFDECLLGGFEQASACFPPKLVAGWLPASGGAHPKIYPIADICEAVWFNTPGCANSFLIP
jgi:hypothetical protein